MNPERRLTVTRRAWTCFVSFFSLLALSAAAHAQYAAFVPPACSSDPFPDVPVSHPFCAWIQQLVADGVTSGCGGGNYCPSSSVTRGQMAVFLERAMRGTAAWDPYKGVFKRTVLVSPVIGDPVASGTALLNALAGITDASASNPYLLKIEPGVYDLGTAPLNLKQYVDVEGSGEGATRVLRAGSATINTGTVVASGLPAGAVELRFLTLENTGGNSWGIALLIDGSSLKLTNVTAIASGAVFHYAVRMINSSALAMTLVTVTASGGSISSGMFMLSSSAVMTDVMVTGSEKGVELATSSASIHGSRLKGTGAALVVSDSQSSAKVSATLLDGGLINGGAAACVGAFNAAYIALNATCG